MRNWQRVIAVIGVLAACILQAHAQTSFPSPGGGQVDGKVQMYIDGNGNAQPCGQSNCGGGGGGGGAATIADGADTAEGATTDAPTSIGAAGTLSAKLRLITSQLDALLTSTTSQIPAGTNTIGKVGIDQTTPGTTNAVAATGNAASGATDTGNPVKVGGVFNTALPTFTTGQRGDLQLTSKGLLLSSISNAGGTIQGVVALPGNSDAQATGTGALYTGNFGLSFNGSAWDRQFTCPNTAAVNVTAGSTTQIVALSGTTTIRVCSITVSMSAAGTFGILSGTGTNCATPAGATTPMALATGAPINAVAPAGGSIYRSTAGGEICIAAATGNVTGWITYVQF